MNHLTKTDGPSYAVHTPSALIAREADDRPVYTESGLRIPPEEVHARRLAREAEGWLALAAERTRMRPHTLVRKALDSLSFSASKRARSFAVPTKLVGTGAQQRALWGLLRERVAPWTELALSPDGDDLVASRDGERLGRLQPKHRGWVRPLVPFGLTLHLARVTGSDYDGYTLGCNVVLGGVGAAVGRLRDALGCPGDGASGGDGPSGDGPSGDGPSGDGPSGDGAARAAPALASGWTDPPPIVRVLPEAAALWPDASPDDVVLWRDAGGRAHASVPHVVRHSPTGVEFGYAGSGPADLAYGVLAALVDRDAAEALYQRSKAEVVARVPEPGGVLRAGEVRAWARAASVSPPAATDARG